MKIEIKKDTDNKALARHEIELEVFGISTTPARKQLLEKIAEKLDKDANLIAIEKIEQQYGTQVNRVWVRVYPTAQTRQKTELKPILGRDSGTKVTPDARKKAKAAKKPVPAETAAEKK